jgi:hypothetical protein
MGWAKPEACILNKQDLVEVGGPDAEVFPLLEMEAFIATGIIAGTASILAVALSLATPHAGRQDITLFLEGSGASRWS